jgi:type IV pilus assembly protein PilC
MPHFSFRAIDKESHVTTGVLVAESANLLERRMADLGLWLIEAKEVNASKASHGVVKVNVNRRDLVDFFMGLATLVDAGVDIAESLSVIVNETENAGLQRVLADVRMSIESGSTFFDAMSAHPQVFTVEICNLIRAGEHSGQLVEACADISDHLEWLDQLMGDVKQATMYPSMVAVAVFGLVFLMFTFVVPQFAVIFDSLDLELPTVTKVVVAVGQFFDSYWWAVLLFVAGSLAFLKYGPVYSVSVATALDKAKLRMPIFGPINELLVLSRFAHNMSLMLKAGVPIVDSIRLVKGVVNNAIMANALADAEQAVTDGRRMSEALSMHSLVSPIVMRMIVVGEETGKLDSCLEKVSKRMDDEIPRRIKRLFGILEPLIIITLIGIVGLVAAAIFMPLFSLMSSI